jgi:hypothetical protein
MVRVAVAEVIEQVGFRRHPIAEVDQDLAEPLLHLGLGAAVARRLVALEPRKHGRGNVELDRELLVRDGGGDLVDLALDRSVVDRIERRMQRIHEKEPDDGMGRNQIDLKFRAGRSCRRSWPADTA